DALASDNDYYCGLLGALAHYREIAAAGGWPRIEDGETLRVEMRSTRTVPLRALLRITGDLPADEPDGDGELFDQALELAVVRFQVRHGLAADGAVGSRTLAAL